MMQLLYTDNMSWRCMVTSNSHFLPYLIKLFRRWQNILIHESVPPKDTVKQMSMILMKNKNQFYQGESLFKEMSAIPLRVEALVVLLLNSGVELIRYAESSVIKILESRRLHRTWQRLSLCTYSHLSPVVICHVHQPSWILSCDVRLRTHTAWDLCHRKALSI